MPLGGDGSEAVMKQRMITVVYGISLLLIILLFYKTIVLNIAVAAVNIVAVYEIFTATKNITHKGLFAICCLYAAAAPFFHTFDFEKTGVIASFLLLTAIFAVLLSNHAKLRAEQAAICFMMTLLSSVSISCIVYLRDEYIKNSALKDIALYYIVIVFISAWITDAGGYIFGRAFGRHKLSPVVSPKKTVEGAVGGVVLAAVSLVASAFIYGFYLQRFGCSSRFNYVSIVILAVLCSILSILGDLGASIIKRQNGIKDFGNILPGHGGVLDRFDSLLFVAPTILIYIHMFPIVTA